MGSMWAGRAWRRSSGWRFGLALLLGLGLRLWLIALGPKIAGDSLVYGDIAKNLLTHGVYGFSRAAGVVRPTLLRLPGYPLFLMGCFAVFGMEHYRAVMFVQAAIDLGTCGLIAGTAGRLFGRRAGWPGLWLAVLCPFTANYVAVPLTETLSIFCVAAAFYGLVGWRGAGLGLNGWVGVIGAALAYAVLLRPEQGLLAAAVIPAMGWMVWRRRMGISGFAPVVVAALLTVLPLGPWTLRNWVAFRVVQPLAPRNANDPGEMVPVGFQRWYRTWGVDFISTDQVYWHYDTDPILVTDLPSRAFDSPEQYARTAALLEEYNQTTTATAAFDARFAELAEERVRAGWWRYYVAMPVARLGDMLFRPRTELLNVPEDWWQGGKRSGVAVLFGAVNLIYFGLAGWGLWRGRWDGVALGMVAFCVLRCGLLATIDNSEPRYTLELFPVLMVWGARVFGETPGVGEMR